MFVLLYAVLRFTSFPILFFNTFNLTFTISKFEFLDCILLGASGGN